MRTFGAFTNSLLQEVDLVDENGVKHEHSDELKKLQKTILESAKRVQEITGVDILN